VSPQDTAPRLSVIWWQDIPAQVVARSGQSSARAELHPRFQRAIDRAAMGGGLAGSDEYLAHWRTVTRPCGADLEAEVAAEVAALEDTHPRERIEEIIRAVRAARPTRGEEPTA
jgi:Virulence factor